VIHPKDLNAPWVFISALNGEWQRNIETILHAQKEKGFRIAFNPGQHNLKEDSALVLQVVRRSDLLILNKDEAIELVLHRNPESSQGELDDEHYLLKNLFQGEVKVVALTDGLRGAWVYNGQALWHLAVPPNVEVVDATGAGDAFTSGFFGAFTMGKPLDECLRFGMANSQKVIQVYGASESLLSLSEMNTAIAHLIPQKLQ
jgi:sugar/nucleoside kinase (ribokinase family)